MRVITMHGTIIRSFTAGSWSLLLLSFGLFASVFAVTHLASFPGSLAHFVEVSGGQRILDLSPSFSSTDVYRRLDAMGEAGRAAYLRLIWTVDIVFPLAALFFLLVWTRFTACVATLSLIAKQIMMFLPWAYFVFDMLENVSVLAMLIYFPNPIPLLGSVIGILTVVKRVAIALAVLGPLVLLARHWLGVRHNGFRRFR